MPTPGCLTHHTTQTLPQISFWVLLELEEAVAFPAEADLLLNVNVSVSMPTALPPQAVWCGSVNCWLPAMLPKAAEIFKTSQHCFIHWHHSVSEWKVWFSEHAWSKEQFTFNLNVVITSFPPYRGRGGGGVSLLWCRSGFSLNIYSVLLVGAVLDSYEDECVPSKNLSF